MNEDKAESTDITAYIRGLGVLALVDADDLPLYRQLLQWQTEAQGSMPKSSWDALASDWKQFLAFCRRYQRKPLPASPETIRLFLLAQARPIPMDERTSEDSDNIKLIEDELERFGIDKGTPKKIATLERYRSTIATAHEAADCPDPCKTKTVKTALKKIRRITDREPAQRDPVLIEHYEAIAALPVATYREQQDQLITLIGFETGLRPHRLAAILVKHIDYQTEDDQLASALIEVPKDKNNDSLRYKTIGARSARWLQDWCQRADISSGAIFRGINGLGTSIKNIGEKPITRKAIGMAMKRCMIRIGENPEKIGGHSTRIGSTIYLRQQKEPLEDIIAHGDWKTSVMPLRYTRRLDVTQSAMARQLRQRQRSTVSPGDHDDTQQQSAGKK